MRTNESKRIFFKKGIILKNLRKTKKEKEQTKQTKAKMAKS